MVGFSLEVEAGWLVPDDALLVVSNNNDNPLAFIDGAARYFYPITSRTDSSIVFSLSTSNSFGEDMYGAAIVSQDKQTVYWENKSKPLP